MRFANDRAILAERAVRDDVGSRPLDGESTVGLREAGAAVTPEIAFVDDGIG